MYRVELIPKTSTLNDIIEPWVCSGRVDYQGECVRWGEVVQEAGEHCRAPMGG